MEAIGAASAAIGGLAVKATDSYADFEQLVGGVETLFGASADIIKDYADNAYETAGMSANTYMETVTGFSASLLQGLEGDTAAAAEVANQAVVDMSDNANKMGTDVELIQNAYQGFAKQNYTMLDNLKLGYGGTAAEMARLVNDSGVLGDAIEVDANTINSVSFDKIVEAIHVVQENMGIAGTTADEAAETISGSIASMKAAGENLITGLANGNADVKTLVEDFVETAQTAGNNFITAFETALDQMPVLIDNIIPSALDLIVEAAETVLPKIVESGSKIISSLIDGISENKDKISETAVNTVVFLLDSILGELPKVVETAGKLLTSLANGIIDALPQLSETAIETIITLAEMLLAPSSIQTFNETALELIIMLVNGLGDAIPQLILAAEEIILGFVEYMLDPGNIGKLMEMSVELVGAIANGLIKSVGTLVTAVLDLISEILYAFGDTDWGEIGKNIVDGLLNGLKKAWSSLTGWFSNAWDGLVGGVKNLLGINSPSRVFGDIGQNMALGVGEGWMKTFAGIKDDIDSDMNFDFSTSSARTSLPGIGLNYNDGYGGLASGGGTVNVTQNIYAQKMTPSEVFTEAQYQFKKAVLSGV